MGDLRDQMLKAGLTTKKAVKAVETEQRRENRKKRKEQPKAAVDTTVSAGAQAILEKAEADRARAAAEAEERQAQEIRAQVTDLIAQFALKQHGKGVNYHFTHDKAVKKLEIAEENQHALSRGSLAIVFWAGKYWLVPDTAAEKIDLRHPEAVIYWRAPVAAPEADDPYKHYQVPDDLMW